MAEEKEKKMAFVLKDQKVLSLLEEIFIIFEQTGKNLNQFAESAEKTAKKSLELNKDFRVFFQFLETLNRSLEDFQNAQADKIKSAGQKLENGLKEVKLLPVQSESYENSGFFKDSSGFFSSFKKTSENLAPQLNTASEKNKAGENTKTSFLDSSIKLTAFNKAADEILKLEKFLEDKSKLLEIAKLLPFISFLSLKFKDFQALNLVEFIAFLGVLPDADQAYESQDEGEKYGDWDPNFAGRASFTADFSGSPDTQKDSKKEAKKKNIKKNADTKAFHERLNPAWIKDLKKNYPKLDKYFLELESKLQAFLLPINPAGIKEKGDDFHEYYKSLSLLLDSLNTYSFHSQEIAATMATTATTAKNSAKSSNSYSFKSQDTINLHSPTGDLEQISKELKNRIFDRSLAGIANSCNYLS